MRKMFAAVAAVSLLCFLWGSAPVPEPASAAEPLGAFSYSLERFETEIAVLPSRKLEVCERFTASFSGYDSHGMIRDLPMGEGQRYRNVEAECDDPDFSPYVRVESSDDGSSFFCVYLRGEGRITGQKRTYTLRYTLETDELAEADYLPVDVLGAGMPSVGTFSAKVTFPEGLADYEVIAPAAVETFRQGNVISFSAEGLGGEQVTLGLKFEEGVLSRGFDASILYALGAGGALLLLAVFLKLLFFRAKPTIAAVQLEPPDGIDPLLMGKYIDGTVDSEDLGAAVFYLADKGHLRIDLQNEKDPVLHAQTPLPGSAPAHLNLLYEGLFRNREKVALSALNGAFFRTAQEVKGAVAAEAGTLYRRSGTIALWLFGVFTVLLLGGFSLFYGILGVFGGYIYWVGALAALISFAVSAAMNHCAKGREFKWKRYQRLLLSAGGVALGLLPCLLGLLFPHPAFGAWTHLILCAAASAAGAVSGNFLTRTKEHSDRLGKILGFRQFIRFTEQDKIAFMLREDPELYYHILPYAQVLGVTDTWTEKFKGLSMQPPAYFCGGRFDLFDVLLFHDLFRTMDLSLSRSMVSRPNSAGGGHIKGGFGGGFGGGGFGGGGMRGC